MKSVVEEARRVAEEGVRAAVARLGVGDAEPPGHLDDAGKALRRALRAHARALGDAKRRRRARDGAADRGRRLRALASAPFRPFLVERGLLVHPEHGVSITLTDCDERAEEEGAADGWDVAAKFAAGMLPAIFHPGDPALALVLAPEHAAGLRELVAGLPAAVLAAEDALGWTYQYWRGAEKRVGAASRNSADNSAAVNSSEVLPTASTASAKRLPMLVMRRRAGCQRRGAR